MRLFLIASSPDIIIKSCTGIAVKPATTICWPPPNTCLNGTGAANFSHIYPFILTSHVDWFPFDSLFKTWWERAHVFLIDQLQLTGQVHLPETNNRSRQCLIPSLTSTTASTISEAKRLEWWNWINRPHYYLYSFLLLFIYSSIFFFVRELHVGLLSKPRQKVIGDLE